MTITNEDFEGIVKHESYPLASAYEAEWVLENEMGPNVLWLTEALSRVMKLERGMRVLDMGCGTALSSIFLAREFDLQVWATDLWTEAGKTGCAGTRASIPRGRRGGRRKTSMSSAPLGRTGAGISVSCAWWAGAKKGAPHE